jgi:eukaryotic-like serine/threonine-protein kinase
MQKRVLKRNDLCGSFRIVRFVARGRASEVYAAEDEASGDTIAIKILSPHALDEGLARKHMEAETALLGAINHPNVIRVLGSGEREGLPFRAMEYAAGKTLRARFDASPEPVSIAVGLCFARQIADALGALHGTGAAHGALTPESILLTEIEEVKLVDLGDAPLTARGRTTARSRPDARPPLLYAAPEQLRGAPADERADVYSAGLILYEMLAGRNPFASPGARRSEVKGKRARAVRVGEPLPLPSVVRGFPASTWELIAKAIAADPSARFASMEAFGDAINDAWNALLEHNRAGAELNAALSLLAQALDVGTGDPNAPAPDLEAILKQLNDAADQAEGLSDEEDDFEEDEG